MYICGVNPLGANSSNVSFIDMKVKLSNEEISKILSDPTKAKEAGVKVSDPWWVIVLKVLAYAIGLLLAGGCTGVGIDQLGIM